LSFELAIKWRTGVVFGGVALGFIIPAKQQSTATTASTQTATTASTQTTTTMPQATVLKGLTPTPVNETRDAQVGSTVPKTPTGPAKGSRNPSTTGSISKDKRGATAIVTGLIRWRLARAADEPPAGLAALRRRSWGKLV
jgi:hypothetical protein